MEWELHFEINFIQPKSLFWQLKRQGLSDWSYSILPFGKENETSLVIINWLGLYTTQGSDFLKNFGQILMPRVSLLCEVNVAKRNESCNYCTAQRCFGSLLSIDCDRIWYEEQTVLEVLERSLAVGKELRSEEQSVGSWRRRRRSYSDIRAVFPAGDAKFFWLCARMHGEMPLDLLTVAGHTRIELRLRLSIVSGSVVDFHVISLYAYA